MTPELTPTLSDVSRRSVLLGASAAIGLLASPALALNTAQAKGLVDNLVADINRVINSGVSERRMYGEFERIFVAYADVPTIARSVLGPPARSLSRAQLTAYTKAFTGYMSRKYGKRFREFIGGKIEVTRAEPWKSHFQVFTVTTLAGLAPFSVVYRVSDRSGRNKFFDMLIEGISMLKSEAVEMGALLEQRKGDVARLTADLQRLG